MNVRLFIDRPAPGAWNMAVDEAFLLDAAKKGIASFRFYGWSEPTLSLGYFQQYADRQQHVASRECAIVRRQTGGGAILHDHELTYGLVLPESHPLTKPADKLYANVHQILIDVLATMIGPSESTPTLQLREQCIERCIQDEPFLCFQRQSPGDVIATVDSVWKVMGSAQRRYHGAVLQHGSLLLERSSSAPELPGLCDLVHKTVATDELIQLVRCRLQDALGLKFVEARLPPELESKAGELANNKYRSAAWTKRR